MDGFARARAVVERAIADRVFPGAAVEVSAGGITAAWTAGRLTYDASAPAVDGSTIYDLASLTKVLAVAPLVLDAVEAGRLALEDRVAARLSAWTGADRETVTLADLLAHAAGLPAHRRYFETLAGRAAFEAAICGEPLDYPPRTRSVYTDLGFMLLGFILEDTGGRPLDGAFEAWRHRAIGVEEIGFRPPAAWRDRIAPTEVDPWRGRLLRGEVHDENCAALGGVAGHAGLFGTAAAVAACGRWWLARLAESSAARRFAARAAVPGSSRALAWDTMLPTSSCGSRFSPAAIGHTGFTGTSLWLDPPRNLVVVLLSNRVHPLRDGDAIRAVRRAFHDAVVADLAAWPGPAAPPL
ncbi:MAG: serine hydrolase domain-containing protein [Acidobacteriota bacterium]